MKQHRLTQVVFLLGGFILFSAFIWWTDIYQDLQTDRSTVERLVGKSFVTGLPVTTAGVVKAAKSLQTEIRVNTARELVRTAKAYTESPQFEKDYARYRDEVLGYATKPVSAARNPLNMLSKKLDKQLNKNKDEEQYPSNPKDAIKMRLQQFLDLSASVDFSARLRGSRFENGAYEAKPNEWKAMYRAGEPVVRAAEEEVRKWLQSLQ